MRGLNDLNTCRRTEEAEYTRLLEEDLGKTEAARRRAKNLKNLCTCP